MNTELEERINQNLRSIVPEEHRELYMTDLAWGSLTPYQREVDSHVHFNGKKWVYDGLNPPPYDLKNGFVYNKITEQPFAQIRDSLYWTCLLDEKAPELIEHVKAKYGSPTPDQHYDILATHTSARFAHMKVAHSHEQIPAHLRSSEVAYIEGIPHGHLTQKEVNQKHEALIKQAIETFKITEETYLASKGDRDELNLSDENRGLLRRNNLETKLKEKDSYEEMMRKLGVEHKAKQEQSITRAGKQKI
ncbi:hypothetical protein F7R25_04115 [Burkholderia stagnalis]|uniref:Uncharacterized protein n=1 Tax=Burkholderia stagnalis TaxID=1503054 RepID=A0A6L3N3N2_9BURK|nr:hypothetical protein [Burkholderia stagnalis]KAB0640690.1 hypothetical protein F7R25_04115 [Burkholderia stagnalis]VWB06593.1 hypothetical protein BST28156_00131 [Burkholderia stagnalis]